MGNGAQDPRVRVALKSELNRLKKKDGDRETTERNRESVYCRDAGATDVGTALRFRIARLADTM